MAHKKRTTFNNNPYRSKGYTTFDTTSYSVEPVSPTVYPTHYASTSTYEHPPPIYNPPHYSPIYHGYTPPYPMRHPPNSQPAYRPGQSLPIQYYPTHSFPTSYHPGRGQPERGSIHTMHPPYSMRGNKRTLSSSQINHRTESSEEESSDEDDDDSYDESSEEVEEEFDRQQPKPMQYSVQRIPINRQDEFRSPRITTDRPLSIRQPLPITSRQPPPITSRQPLPMTVKQPLPTTTRQSPPTTARQPLPATARPPHLVLMRPPQTTPTLTKEPKIVEIKEEATRPLLTPNQTMEFQTKPRERYAQLNVPFIKTTNVVVNKYLLKREDLLGKYDITDSVVRKQKKMTELMRITKSTGSRVEGIRKWIWMPNASANSQTGPPSGFVMVIDNPALLRIEPYIFNRDKFCWGTYAVCIPNEWKNDAGQTFGNIITTNKENIISALKNDLGDYSNLENGSAFIGIYSSQRMDTGFTPELWVVVHCGDKKLSNDFYDSIRNKSKHRIQVESAKKLMSNMDRKKNKEKMKKENTEEENDDDNDDDVDKEKTDKDNDEEEEEEKEKIKYNTNHLHKIVSHSSGPETWQSFFGFSNKHTTLQFRTHETRRQYVVNLLNALGFSKIDSDDISTLKKSAHTITNFVCNAPGTKSTYAYYAGATRIFQDTRSVIVHGQPLYGIRILLGEPSDDHPMGNPWPETPSELFGAFPISTGRVSSLSATQNLRIHNQNILFKEDDEDTIEPSTLAAFFTRDDDPLPTKSSFTSREASSIHERLPSHIYRRKGSQWYKRIKEMGWCGDRIELKPHLVMCSNKSTARRGCLSDLLST